MPVALNLYKVRQDRGEAGDFFRSVQRQKPNYQGLWVVSPGGKVLAAHQDMSSMSDPRGKWARKALADLEAGLKAFGPVQSESGCTWMAGSNHCCLVFCTCWSARC